MRRKSADQLLTLSKSPPNQGPPHLHVVSCAERRKTTFNLTVAVTQGHSPGHAFGQFVGRVAASSESDVLHFPAQ